jgi:aryl-alcohol dehydrogenase-like predicted oxidoreductase
MKSDPERNFIMPLNQYLTLGRSGLRVSPFCLGTMTFGNDLGWGSDVAESVAVLSRYLEEGSNFIDTANSYTRGHSEKILATISWRSANEAAWFSRPNSSSTSSPVIQTAVALVAKGSSRNVRNLYDVCRPTTSISTTYTTGTGLPQTMRALDDLVTSGKVRYLGFSDAPAWKVSQAQTIAHFRGWTPLIGLQVEYSLMERTVEGELVPMAEELGLGVLPWSPLKIGRAFRKIRANGQKMQGYRGAFVGDLTEKQLDIINVAQKIAAELDADVPTVALAWVQKRPGVASTVLGARTVDHLDANLEALELQLTPEHILALNTVSKPTLNFPADFNANLSPNFAHAGTTVNGVPSKLVGNVPKNDDERW